MNARGALAIRIRFLLLLAFGAAVSGLVAGCARRPPAPLGESGAGAVPVEATPDPAATSGLPQGAESAAPVDPRSLPCDAVLRIEVRKRERMLEAWCRGGGRRGFPIGLSRVPEGAKQKSGDERMPEGDYRIAGVARPSRFHLFLPIDYPSVADAERGLDAGLISRATRDRIVAAHVAGRLPPQDTALGGWLGFHGEGERWRGELDLEWTRGCVAVSDATIRWLARFAPRGTPVSIRP